MNTLRPLLWRIRDHWITQRTRRAIENRECPHDGWTDPMCTQCLVQFSSP